MEHYLVVCLILVWSSCLQCSYSAKSTLHFKLSSGEEISCVPINEQPSLKSLDHASNPYLKLRSEDEVQEALLHRQPSLDSLPKKPTFIPSDKSIEEQTQVIPDATEIRSAEQLFMTEVGTCPEGMLPILRNQRSLPRTRGISRQGVDSMATHKSTVTSTNTSLISDPSEKYKDHEWAITSLSTSGDRYRGASGTINVWSPFVELSSEFSSGRLMLTAGSYDQWNLNQITVGWEVYSDRFGDNSTRLFVEWTRDAHHSTGCVNLACPGFVQTSSSWVLGGLLYTSETNGEQRDLGVIVFLDRPTDAWWLNINDIYVGYWPNSLFTMLKAGATYIEWGGEIRNNNGGTGKRHTLTDMGSNEFADAGYGRAAYVKSMLTVNQQNYYVDAPLESLYVTSTKVDCYNAKKFRDTNSTSSWNTYMYFGGSGYNSNCPI